MEEATRTADMAANATKALSLSEDQVAVLEENFRRLGRHPDGTTLMLIAAECGLSEEDTKVSIASVLVDC